MSFVRRYVEHLQTIELSKEKRNIKRHENMYDETMKSYKDINWVSYYENNSLAQLKVKTLDTYLEENNMVAYLSLKKKEKVVAISHHIAFKQLQRSLAVSKSDAMVVSDGESESEADEDDIINIAVTEDSSSASSEEEDCQEESQETSSDEEFEEDLSHLFCVTKSGRLTQTWACSRYRCKLLLLPLHFDKYNSKAWYAKKIT